MVDLNRLITQYNKLYNADINPYNWSHQKAEKILEWCNKMRSSILMESHFNSYNTNSDYAKVLILETIARRVLIEIAPKRIRRKRK